MRVENRQDVNNVRRLLVASEDMDDRTRWNEKYRAGHPAKDTNSRLQKYLQLLKPGRALDLAGGQGQNGRLLAGSGWDVILVDISDEALARARDSFRRVQADALALPFAASTFDTIICTYFFEPRIDLHALLKPGGTLFFETYTTSHAKYRPDISTNYLFDPSRIRDVFKGLEVLSLEETDDGERVYATFVGRKMVE